MTKLLRVALVAGVLAIPSSLPAQVTDPALTWHLGGARRATPTGPGRLKEEPGVLVLDFVSRQIRLDVAGVPVLQIPWDRIVAVHYENGEYPRRFLRRTSFYCVIHYTNDAGQPAAETIRLLAEKDARALRATFEDRIGVFVDQSETFASFLGLPIRVGPGTRVVVTGEDGRRVSGALRTLSTEQLTLVLPDADDAVFTRDRVRRIRLRYSPKHDAVVGLVTGAALGAWSTWLAAGLSGCFSETGHTSDCHVGRVMLTTAAAMGGVGAVISTTVGATRYPFNQAFDVYRRSSPPSRSPAVSIGPEVGRSRTAINVSLRF